VIYNNGYCFTPIFSVNYKRTAILLKPAARGFGGAYPNVPERALYFKQNALTPAVRGGGGFRQTLLHYNIFRNNSEIKILLQQVLLLSSTLFLNRGNYRII
jgi:hypothetical protein